MPSIPLVDTHCHLFMPPLGHDVTGALDRAAARGVDRVVVPSYDPPSWTEVRLLAERPGVFAAYGVHPWVAGPWDPSAWSAWWDGLDEIACPPVAVGEIGLDTKLPDGPGLAAQLAVLRPQLEYARDGDLPVILHCRGAFEELLAEVERFGGALRGVLHAWSRGPELAARFTGAGLALGLGGAVTRDRARRLLQTARTLPLDSFILETDAPSIGLDGVLPAETEPAHVADIAAALAVLRNETLETIAEVTTDHAQQLFRLGA
ncbi:MAG: TatD family hydrolase [bacterium]|nr:TatD family hydrolase [bacterium]